MFLLLMIILQQQERSDVRKSMQRKRKRTRKCLEEASKIGMICDEAEEDADESAEAECDNEKKMMIKLKQNRTKGKKSVINLINSIKLIAGSNNMKEIKKPEFFLAEKSITYLACLIHVTCLLLAQFVVVDGSTLTDFDGKYLILVLKSQNYHSFESLLKPLVKWTANKFCIMYKFL